MRYPRTVEAARGVGISKMDLAEALFREIPPVGRGRRPAGVATDPEQFEAAAVEIAAETGEQYAATTLREYRNVAAWVAGNSHDSVSIPWTEASWSAHREAYLKGETFTEFARRGGTVRQVRGRNGGVTSDVPGAARAINENPAHAARFIEGLSNEGMEAVAEAALHREAQRHGIDTQPRRTVAQPEPEYHRLIRRIGVDLIVVTGLINGLRTDGHVRAADAATTELREVLAEGLAQLEVIPDTIEGLT